MCIHLETVLSAMPTMKGELTEGSKKVFQAFAKDIDNMDNRIRTLSSDMQTMKQDINDLKQGMSNVNGKIDTVIELIESRLNSNVDKERMIGATVTNIMNTKKFWLVVLVMVILFMLSGVALIHFMENSQSFANVAEGVSKLI